MGGMGEEDIVGLLGIDQPGDIFILLFQLLGQLDEIGLFLGTPLGRFMAFHTFGQRRNTGESAILPKEWQSSHCAPAPPSPCFRWLKCTGWTFLLWMSPGKMSQPKIKEATTPTQKNIQPPLDFPSFSISFSIIPALMLFFD